MDSQSEPIPPVIFKLPKNDCSFKSLDLHNLKLFRDQLITYAKKTKDSCFGEGGDLFIVPLNTEQQQKLHKLSELGGLKLVASLPKSVTTNAEVIEDVTTSVSQEDILGDIEK